MMRSAVSPIAIAQAMAATTPMRGLALNQCPKSVPTATEYAAQLTPARMLSGTNLRRGKPVAPAVILTAMRPTGM
jgi:hypothetical protein